MTHPALIPSVASGRPLFIIAPDTKPPVQIQLHDDNILVPNFDRTGCRLLRCCPWDPGRAIKVKGGHFNENFKYDAKEIRFSTKGAALHAILSSREATS
jgi:hypothetical protein